MNIPYEIKELLLPLNEVDFIEKFWGKQFCHIQGRAGKFSHLFSWDDLNSILEQHRLEPPRIRLTLDGKIIPPESFIEYTSSPRYPELRIPRLLVTEINRLLMEGATLLIDGIDELVPTTKNLCETLEFFFGAKIKATVYATWGTTAGLPVHWGYQESFILQLSGIKEWTIYPDTRPYPLAKDFSNNIPPTEFLWKNTIQEGDFLYVPRGWWHSVLPVKGPSLHLSINVYNPTGIDLISWIFEKLKDFEFVRKDLDRHISRKEKQQYVEQILHYLTQVWHDDILKDFFADYDANATARPHFTFPQRLTEITWNDNPKTILLQLNSQRKLHIKIEGEKAIVKANKKTWFFNKAYVPILEFLDSNRKFSLEDFISHFKHIIEEEKLKRIIIELINVELVVS